MDTATAQAFLEENFAPWVLALQPQVTDVQDMGLTLSLPITPEIARVGGMVAGQALATLADTAMVLACGAANGEMIPVGTVTLDTQFLRPATGDRVDAHAEVTRMGRSLIFARCRMVAAPSGKDVALATATFAR